MLKADNQLFSVIVPIYKKEKIIRKNLKEILKDLKKIRIPFEIIAVVDGTEVDKSFREAKKIHSKFLRVVGYKTNHGKGYAVRYGIAKSRGSIIGLLDSGGDLKASGFSMMLEHFNWYKADIIVGSKRHPVSYVDYPWQRRMLSWGYQKLVKILFGLNITDTQVGMKIYRQSVIKDVLPRLLVKKFAYDIEILAVSHYLGYKRIFEAPVAINFPKDSSITSKSVLRIITGMVIDTMAVFYRLKMLRYYDKKNKRRWIYDKELDLRINVG